MPYTALDATLAQAAPVTTIGTPLTNVGETLASLRTEVLAEINRTIDATRVNLWINKAYRKLCAMIDISELNGSLSINTTVGQNQYALPKQVAWIKRVPLVDTSLYPLTGGRNMEKTDLNTYRELADPPSGYNYNWGPYKYFRYGRVLVLWPTPIAVKAVTVDFRVRPLDLVNDNDSPILPEEWHESLLLRARYVAFRSLQMFDKAGLAQNDFVTSIRELLNTDAEEESTAQPTMTPMTYRTAQHFRDPLGNLPDWAR